MRKKGDRDLKLIYVVIDGLGDLPIKELGDQTPLEYAETPNMDYLASRGKLGLMYTVRKGIAPESDVAVISILGYDPYKYHVGRGPLEAYGVGMDFEKGDLALRCNFATLGKDGKIIDRRAGRDLTPEEASRISEAVNREVRLTSHPAEFEFKNTLGHRGVLVIRSKKIRLSRKISNTDPSYEIVGGLGVANSGAELTLRECSPLDNSEASRISAELVNEFTWKSHEVLEKHEVNKKRVSEGKLKANIILSRDAGDELPKFYNLSERYKVRFACLADMPVERGISRLVGMHLVEIPSPSGNIMADSKLRADNLLNLLPTFDCFYIHLKGPDEAGHDGEFERKTQIIKEIDNHFFGKIVKEIDLEKTVLCVTADHSTPCRLKSHSDDPVPLLIAGGKINPDGIKKFSEKESAKGSLGTLKSGTELMPMLMHLIRQN